MSNHEKPCPFCGSTNLKSGGDDKIVGTWCLDCEAIGPNHYGRHEWNDRADRIEELEAKLAKAVEEKLDAIDTLNAWFDRRELAHDAVDQAVVNAASGYLRISRVGGMSQKKSDLVLGVIQDMAHLSVFADLFARTTLAELSKERSEKG